MLDEQTMLKIRAIVGRDACRLISSQRTTIISTTNPERSSNPLDGFYKYAMDYHYLGGADERKMQRFGIYDEIIEDYHTTKSTNGNLNYVKP